MIEKTGIQARIGNLMVAMSAFKNWPSFIYHYLRNPGVPFEIRMRDGTRIHMRPGTSDFRIVREIMIWKEYEPDGFEIGPEFTVVDIGAQIGVFSVCAGRRTPRGRVLSFEPHPDNFALLKSNLKANQLNHVRAYNCAVAEKAGPVTFFVSSFNTGGHSIVESEGGDRKIDVEAVRLDDVLREEGIQRIDYLKVDCEGAEVQILRSLPDDIINSIQCIVMEIHHPEDATDRGLAGWLKDRGFHVRVQDAMVYASRTGTSG